MRFENQTAVVAGGARGIGKGIAFRLAREGASVTILDVLEEEMAAVLSEAADQGITFHSRMVDITASNEVYQAIESVIRQTGRLEVLVNTAGIIGQTSQDRGIR